MRIEPDMRRHVVQALCVMLEDRVAVGYCASEPALQVVAHGRVGILAKQQRAAGMRREDVRDTGQHMAACHHLADLGRDLAEAAPARVHGETLLRDVHDGLRARHG